MWCRSFSEKSTASFKRGFDYSYARYGKKSKKLEKNRKTPSFSCQPLLQAPRGAFSYSFSPYAKYTHVSVFKRVQKKTNPAAFVRPFGRYANNRAESGGEEIFLFLAVVAY